VGAHPRFGVVDVVPFVPLDTDAGDHDRPAGSPPAAPTGDRLDAAIAARDAFAVWASETLGLPCFLYGPLAGGTGRSLPDVRRRAFRSLPPDFGPPAPHPTAGAAAVGARRPLVAYNLWLDGADAAVARTVASGLRSPQVRALGFDLAAGVQVSCNLLDPTSVGPAEVYDAVEALLRTAGPGGRHGGVIGRAELVGLVPAPVLERVPARRWAQLDLGPDRTIEARLGRQAPAGSAPTG